MSNEIIIRPSDDIVFKRLFGKTGNEKYIKDLLEAILEIKIESVELGKDIELIPEKLNEKMGRLDVRVHLQDGTMIDVEMQNVNQKNIEKRMTYYISQLYTSEMKRSGKYRDLKKTIGIGILNFNYFEDINKYHTKWKMREENNKEKTLEEHEIHFIELPKFKGGTKDIERKLDQWLAFIENSDRGLVEMAKKKNKILEEAAKEYEYLTGEEEMQRLAYLRQTYEWERNSMLGDAREDGLAEGRAKGIAEGRAEGEKNEKIKTAKKMLELGTEIEFIEKVTGLTKEEIEKLK